MGRAHPRQPDRQEVFSETQHPIAERFGTCVDRGSGAGFRSVRSERDSAGEQRGAPAPLWRRGSGGGESKQSGGGRANKSVDQIPDRIDIGYFVRKEFQNVKCSGDSEDPGMRKNLKLGGEMDNSESLKQTQSGRG